MQPGRILELAPKGGGCAVSSFANEYFKKLGIFFFFKQKISAILLKPWRQTSGKMETSRQRYTET